MENHNYDKKNDFLQLEGQILPPVVGLWSGREGPREIGLQILIYYLQHHTCGASVACQT